MALALIVSWTITPAAARNKKKELLKSAEAAEQNQQFDDAERLYCELVQEDHKNKEAQQKCADLQAANAVRRASDEAHVRAGQAALAAEKFEDAIMEFRAVKTAQYLPTAQKYLTDVIPTAQQKAKADAERREQARKEQERKAAELEIKMSGAFQQGVVAYRTNDFTHAKERFLAVTSGSHKADAEQYLSRIEQYEKALVEGWNNMRAGKYSRALTAYRKAAAIKKDGPGEPEAKIAKILNTIAEQKVAAAQERASEKTSPSPEIEAEKTQLADAIGDFYKGAYTDAERKLTTFTGSPLRKALSEFYLGASKLSRYYLAGAPDDKNDLYDSALQNLRDARNTPGFSPPEGYVSPKILAIYAQANH